MSGSNKFLEAALKYHKAGFSLIPALPKEKRPAVSWEIFQKVRCEPVALSEWWIKWPNANILLVCGQISRGLTVLDVDPRNGGKESLAKLGNPLPATWCVRTGGGGWHYYFKSLNLVQSGILAPGLDLQGEGKLVIAPPSIHPNGNPYAWVGGMSPKDLRPAEFPNWMAVKQTQKTANPKGWAEEAIGSLTEGTRNSKMTQLAGRYLSKGMSEPETLSLLTSLNKTHCKPPLENKEIEAIVKGISRKEKAKAGDIITSEDSIAAFDEASAAITKMAEPYMKQLEMAHGSKIAWLTRYYFRISQNVKQKKLTEEQLKTQLENWKSKWRKFIEEAT